MILKIVKQDFILRRIRENQLRVKVLCLENANQVFNFFLLSCFCHSIFPLSKQVLRAQVAKEREENQVSICLEWQENLAPVLRLVSQ